MLTMKKPITQEQVSRVKLHVPEAAGARWEGVSHGDLVDEVVKQVRGMGWSTANPTIALNSTKSWMAVTFLIRVPDEYKIPGHTMSLGLFNSNDRRRALTAYTGVVDRSTGLGYVLGKSEGGPTHQKAYSVEDTVGRVLSEWCGSLKEVGRMIDRLKGFGLTEGERCETLFRCCRLPAVTAFPWRRLWLVDKYYLEAKDYTSWGLYTAVSRTLTKHPPMKQLDVMSRVVDTLPSL